jgi:hypothetical protein
MQDLDEPFAARKTPLRGPFSLGPIDKDFCQWETFLRWSGGGTRGGYASAWSSSRVRHGLFRFMLGAYPAITKTDAEAAAESASLPVKELRP